MSDHQKSKRRLTDKTVALSALGVWRQVAGLCRPFSATPDVCGLRRRAGRVVALDRPAVVIHELCAPEAGCNHKLQIIAAFFRRALAWKLMPTPEAPN